MSRRLLLLFKIVGLLVEGADVGGRLLSHQGVVVVAILVSGRLGSQAQVRVVAFNVCLSTIKEGLLLVAGHLSLGLLKLGLSQLQMILSSHQVVHVGLRLRRDTLVFRCHGCLHELADLRVRLFNPLPEHLLNDNLSVILSLSRGSRLLNDLALRRRDIHLHRDSLGLSSDHWLVRLDGEGDDTAADLHSLGHFGLEADVSL